MDEKTLGELYAVMNELQIIHQLWASEMRHVLPGDLTLAQFSVLNWFSRVDDAASPGRLTRAFQVTKGAMTNTLGRLEDAGLVEISPDPSSGRQKIVRRTRKGARLRESAIKNTFGNLEELGESLDAKRLIRILPVLRSLRRDLDGRRDV